MWLFAMQIGIGTFVVLMLLSGWGVLENTGFEVARVKFSIGGVSIRISVFILLVAVGYFTHESYMCYSLIHTRPNMMTVMQEEHFKKNMWMHYRNWWMSLFNFTIWTLIWRLPQIIQGYRHKLKDLKKIV
eukprot:GHVR01179721.1.p1 GENE.GHVR01179721.1~~GHVR01179721.1.p1  ORF type:complete len:130 (-),score=16.54 GHVR01179721.1:77-466(-)